MLVDRYVEKGDYLSIGNEVAKVADMDPIRVRGFLTELEIVGVRTGKEASAKLSTGETPEGKISYISPEADAQSRMFQVEMETPNPGNAIRAGVTTELIVPHDRTMAHFISPAHILLSDDGTIGVMLADEEGVTAFCPINIVKTTSEGIWVDGMPDKTLIITQGKDFITPGQKVQLVIENPTDAAQPDAPDAEQPAAQPTQ
jgi:multidrug efflux system membrane fusion protein